MEKREVSPNVAKEQERPADYPGQQQECCSKGEPADIEQAVENLNSPAESDQSDRG